MERQAPASQGKGRTKAAVKDKLREAVADLEAGVTTDAGYTVQDAVADFLQKGLKGRTKGTIDNYRSLADHNVIPQIGGIKVKELTADQLDDWLDERAEELSTRLLRLIHQIVERAIRQAQARDKVRRNVASLVDVPGGTGGPAVQGDDAKARPSRSSRPSSLAVTGSRPTWCCPCWSGVRTEEARAITWDGSISSPARWPSTGLSGSRVTPRTARPPRPRNCPPRRYRHSAQHHARKAAERLAAGERWQGHDLVFCREDGTPLDRPHVRKEFRKVTRAARLGGHGRPAN